MSTGPNTPLEPIIEVPTERTVPNVVEEAPAPPVVVEVPAPTGCLPIGEFFAGLFGRRRERRATPRMVAKGMSLDAKDAANRFGI
jgi:hypothetical protein